MLIYHPAYDAHHCIFRSLLIMTRCKVIEAEKLRILDFYLCFPSELKDIRLAKGYGDARKISQNMKNEYHGPVNKKLVFRDLEHIQLAAFRTIAASRLVDAAEYESGLMRRTDIHVPTELGEALNTAAEEQKTVLNFVIETLADIPLRGDNGLKHRTGLMEYRYDVV
jgi:hypothetical protein